MKTRRYVKDSPEIRTVGQLKQAISDVPDDTNLASENTGDTSNVINYADLVDMYYDPNGDKFIHPDCIEEMYGKKHNLKLQTVLILG